MLLQKEYKSILFRLFLRPSDAVWRFVDLDSKFFELSTIRTTKLDALIDSVDERISHWETVNNHVGLVVEVHIQSILPMHLNDVWYSD